MLGALAVRNIRAAEARLMAQSVASDTNIVGRVARAPFAAKAFFPASTPSSSRPKATTNLPKNILLLRHGRSLGNEDETLFARLPDWRIPLSAEGRRQARTAGARIQRAAGSDPLVFYVSPYLRTKQTFDEVRKAVTSDVLLVREEPRLREQDFGNFQNPKLMLEAKRERANFGRFFYRFPDGESGADVFDRVAAFCSTFNRDMNQIGRSDSTAVFITHGITARMFVMRYLHWTVEDFEALHNPPNCGLLHLRRFDEPGGPAYRLKGESRELIKAPKDPGIGKALQIGSALRDGDSRSSEDGEEGWDFSETAWGL
uniref:Phosphoglycerate mutase (2,3-diphosphoglycerate-dependent) n=1 Tax=Odontella aurita TaxID=265563 RepID=A0A7S4I622_9STRA|mmetsp:Transcript_2029/g.5344  ORF Transcript_2029/g.5344 Transcript_2029/m.5344 type:complete len:315 (+) Transcript_2029:170-1114(+)